MLGDGSEIVCRRCNETIQRDAGNCPHCGAPIRGTTVPLVVAIFGGIVALASLATLQIEYFLFGLLVAAIPAYILWEKRSRVQKASDRGTEEATGPTFGKTE